MNKQISIYFVCISCFFLFIQCKNNSVVNLFAAKLNKQCPAIIDAHTTLLSAESSIDTLILNYQTDYDIEYFKDKEYLKLSRNNYLHHVASNPGMEPIREANVTIIHRYTNENNELLIEAKYTPNEYHNIKNLKEEDIFPMLLQMVEKSKEFGPQYVDNNIYLIEMKAEKPATLEYTYQATNADVGEGEIIIHKSALIKYLKENGSLTKLRDNNVTFRYKIVDKNMQPMNEFEVTSADYK